MKKIFALLTIILGISLLLTSCGQKGSSDENENAIKIPVETIQVIRKTITKEVRYTGDIKAEQEVKIYSKVPDRIMRFEVDEGDYVNKGDVVVRIEATKIEQAVIQANAAVASTKAQLANLESEYQRAQRLIKENAMSQQQYEAVKTQYEATQALAEQSQAALIQAESQLADANITTPISGIVGVRNYDPGDMATGPLALLTIVQMNKVKVVVKAPEQDFGQLELGQCATIYVLSFADEKFTGKISKISPVLDPITRMGKIEIVVDNSDKRLKPGMFAEVEICINTLVNVLAIPKHAVIENIELKRINGEDVAVVNSDVFVAKDGIAVLKSIKIGYTNGTVAVIDSGIVEGERIVVVGQQSLKDSSQVKVVN